ncbi:MAG: MBL fold metallo-hydrolase [Calditrichaeota bacterium]|nr:MBL fold metallo-hydrolase [Calditrichota bacterium]
MSDHLKLHFIGTGTIAPDPNRSCSCVLIETSQLKILVDIGAGSLRRLAVDGVNLHEIDYIFLTHFHPDHIGDLVPFIFSMRNTREMAIDGKMLRVWGPSGIYRYVQGMQRSYGRWMQNAADEVRFYELKRPFLEFPGFRIAWRKVVHNQESVGYRFDFNGYSIAFSGDSGYCQDLVKLCEDVDLAVLECSHADDHAVKGHLSPSLSAQIAQKARAKRLMLTHFYPDALVENPTIIAKKYYEGEMEMARDGMIINLTD